MEPLRAQDPSSAGPYRLLRKLGAGGMGEVYLAESPEQRKVAVKIVRPQYADDPGYRQRFAREVAAAKLAGGRYTAPVVDADPDGSPPWLATEYIPGPSMANAVKKNGPFDTRIVCRLGGGLAAGLAAVHACGLVHRDFKPANIILGSDGPRIIDFGLAQPQGADSPATAGTVTGTPAFMAPEQFARGRADARSDVFSLGSVLAYAATGRSPFDADTFGLIAARVAGGPPSLDGITGPLREAIEACLAKKPGARPGLKAVFEHLASAARVPPKRPSADPVYLAEFAPVPKPPPEWVLPLQHPPRQPRPARRMTGAFSAVTDALTALRPPVKRD
jgi:serine/threonine protein kinase